MGEEGSSVPRVKFDIMFDRTEIALKFNVCISHIVSKCTLGTGVTFFGSLKDHFH